MENNISKTSINMPESLHRRVKVACTERGVSFGTAIIQGLEMWLNSVFTVFEPAVQTSAQSLPYTPAEGLWVDKLLYVLRQGKFSHVTGIQLSLDCFESVARKEKRT